jgi:predicted metal-dependent hydrolase
MIPPFTLELVVPARTRPKEVESFLKLHADWIERARAEMEARYPLARRKLPECVTLPAIGRRWEVRYDYRAGVRPRRRAFATRLELTAPDPEHPSVRHLLRRWLLERARLHLKPWLLREAEVMALAPNRVQIRTQRTRWGSCSAKGIICLNAGLLFLEPAVVRYVLVHELCHLRHLNHSRRYWDLVERYEPRYRALDRRLNESWADIPAWALGP